MAQSDNVTAIITVSVAIVSAGAALLGQAIGVRAARTESDRSLKVAMRGERRTAIDEFLVSVQSVELIIDEWKVAPHTPDYRDAPRATSGGQAAAAVHTMWLQVRRLELVCSSDVVRAASEYARTANDYVWDKDLPDEVRHGDYLAAQRRPFVDAARRDLGLDPTYSAVAD